MNNSEAPERELKYKLTKRGRNWMAWRLSGAKWVPLMTDYSLASSAVGCLEDEMSRDVWKEPKHENA